MLLLLVFKKIRKGQILLRFFQCCPDLEVSKDFPAKNLACKTSNNNNNKEKKSTNVVKNNKNGSEILFAPWLLNSENILMELQNVFNIIWYRPEFLPIFQTKGIYLQLVLTCSFIARSANKPEVKIKTINKLR